MNPQTVLANIARRLDWMFPGYFPEAKHNHYRDFGFPERLEFANLRAMYDRNSIAKAAVDKTTKKIWEESPELRLDADAPEPSESEAVIAKHLNKIRFWQKLAIAERRSFTGGYSGVILRIADNRRFSEPLQGAADNIEALVEVIPASAGQLKVSNWQDDESADDFGQPLMFTFDEAAVGDHARPRKFEVHPSRVIIWSDDGTVHCKSMLHAGFNDLMTIEKVVGAGGEGFWKNAKAAPVLQVDKEAKAEDIAKAMGVPIQDVPDKMNEAVTDYQKGFDQLLMLQGMEAKSLSVSLPSPEHFFGIALQSFAAGVDIPIKVLVGNITGERASTEDAREFAKTCKGRRNDKTIPSVMAIVERLVEHSILPGGDWSLKWADLTESTMDEKIDRADKMAGINQKMTNTGEIVFTGDEMRETIGKDPLTDGDKYQDEGDDLTV